MLEDDALSLFSLSLALHASTKERRVDKDGEEVLAYCMKHSKDSVELAGLCRLLFFTIWVAMFAVCLSVEISSDIGCTDC